MGIGRDILTRIRCGRFEARLVDLAEGSLGERQRAAVERHVASCRRCADALGALRQIPDALRAPEIRDREEAFWIGQRNSIMAALPTARSQGRSAASPGPWFGWRTAMVPATALLAAMIGYRALVDSPVSRGRTVSEPSELEAETVIALLSVSASLFSEDALLADAHGDGIEMWNDRESREWVPQLAQPTDLQELSEEDLQHIGNLVGGYLG